MNDRGTRPRKPTLSISLTPELAAAVSERVRSGLYTSASELIREALRLFLREERARLLDATRGASFAADAGPAAARFEEASHLMDLGTGLRERTSAESAGARDRLRALEEREETGPGLRISPERLARLKVRE